MSETCVALSQGTVSVAKTDTFVPVIEFYPCLKAWFVTDKGKYHKNNIRFNADNSKIIGYKEPVNPVKIERLAQDGP